MPHARLTHPDSWSSFITFVDPSDTGGPQLNARHVKDDGDDILERDEDARVTLETEFFWKVQVDSFSFLIIGCRTYQIEYADL